jgi:hypothetical protein
MLICKECRDDKKGLLGSRLYQIADNRFSPGDLVLSRRSVDENDEKIHFHPTAAVRDGSRSLILLLSSKPPYLLEVNEDGTILQKYPLDPAIYKQPEGIALGADGTLYISTEAGHSGSAELFILRPRDNPAKQ